MAGECEAVNDTLFRDSEHAVRFAFSITEMSTCPSPGYIKALLRTQATGSQRARGMSIQDWHAEGQLIRRRVINLEPDLCSYAWACYSWSAERDSALTWLYDLVRRAMPSIKDGDLLEMLVRRYVDRGRGHKTTVAEISRAKGLHHSWVAELDRRVGKALDDLHFRFFEAMDAQLFAAGLIPEPPVYA